MLQVPRQVPMGFVLSLLERKAADRDYKPSGAQKLRAEFVVWLIHVNHVI